MTDSHTAHTAAQPTARRRHSAQTKIILAFGVTDHPPHAASVAQLEADPVMDTLLVFGPMVHDETPPGPQVVLPMDERIIPADRRVQAFKDARDLVDCLCALDATAPRPSYAPAELAMLPAYLSHGWTVDLEWWCAQDVFAPDTVCLRVSRPDTEGGLQISVPTSLMVLATPAIRSFIDQIRH